MKKRYILILSIIAILLLFILLFSKKTNETINKTNFHSEYIIKPVNDSCPEGTKMTYSWDDISPGLFENGCKPISLDAGKICTKKVDCINNCILVGGDFYKLGCKPPKGGNCPEVVDCKEIKGICEATKDESPETIIEQDKVLFSCIGV